MFRKCTISHSDSLYLKSLELNIGTVQSELNVIDFLFEPLEKNIVVEPRFNNKELGKTFRKGANSVKEFIESLDQSTLYAMYSGTNKNMYPVLEIDGQTVKFDYPSEYFELVAVPDRSLGESSYVSIDSDLMVRIDPTYDESINTM